MLEHFTFKTEFGPHFGLKDVKIVPVIKQTTRYLI